MEITIYFEAIDEDTLGNGRTMVAIDVPLARNVEDFDKVLDSQFSNFKMRLLTELYKKYPHYWHKNSPIEHDKLKSLETNG